jgi:hypothetical protein
MVYRLFLASTLAFGVSTCAGQELLTGSAMPAAGEVALLGTVDTTRISSTCRAVIRARNRARMRLVATPSDLVARNKAITFDALISESCR